MVVVDGLQGVSLGGPDGPQTRQEARVDVRLTMSRQIRARQTTMRALLPLKQLHTHRRRHSLPCCPLSNAFEAPAGERGKIRKWRTVGSQYLHRVSKNDNDVAHYNFNAH